MPSTLLNPGCDNCYSCDVPCVCDVEQGWPDCGCASADYQAFADLGTLPDVDVTIGGIPSQLPYSGTLATADPLAAVDLTGTYRLSCGGNSQLAGFAVIGTDEVVAGVFQNVNYILGLAIGYTSTTTFAQINITLTSGMSVMNGFTQANADNIHSVASPWRDVLRLIRLRWTTTRPYWQYVLGGDCRSECNTTLQRLSCPGSGTTIPAFADSGANEASFGSWNGTNDAFDISGMTATATTV